MALRISTRLVTRHEGKSGPRRIQRLLFLLLLAFAAACVVLTLATRGAMNHLPFLIGHEGAGRLPHQQAGNLVDLAPWQTIQALAPLAVTVQEESYARDAERLADHEVDQAFSMALRKATARHTAPTGKALVLSDRISHFEQVVKEDQALVDKLSAHAKTAAGAVQTPSPEELGASDLDLAKAQLALDTDQLNDAKRDYDRATGNERVRIQQELAAHETSMRKQKAESAARASAATSDSHYGTLYGRLIALAHQQSRNRLILEAQSAALSASKRLRSEHNQLESQANAEQAPAGNSPAERAGRLAAFQHRTQQNKTLAIYDDRIQTEEQLASVYGQWSGQVLVQRRIVVHLILQSVTAIVFVFIGLIVVEWLIGRLLERPGLDARRIHTLRTILKVCLQILAVAIVLILAFGMPRQTPTILGLATAGLVVALQDYVLAFMGWFVLVGRNGIRVGDWVEINSYGGVNSVVGEVVEIGLFRTTMLEAGNWTDLGHPTGRRISFVNSFAIRGQYFNFSTSGQWMWDEIVMSVPRSEGLYAEVEAIQGIVTEETTKTSSAAEQEWKQAARQTGMRQFSAQPAVILRPTGSGVELRIRYVTRAAERLEMRNRLYQRLMKIPRSTETLPAPVSFEDGAVPESL